jgi:hypothetical protein
MEPCTCPGTCIDDPRTQLRTSLGLLAPVTRGMAGDTEVAFEVHGHHRIPVGFGEAGEHAVAADAGVVDHHVQTAEGFDGLAHDQRRIVVAGDVVAVGLAAAFAHGLQTEASPAALQFMQQRAHQPGAGRAQWMAEGNRPAVDVGLFMGITRLLEPGHRDRGEGFVDLHPIDVFQLHPGSLECISGGRDGCGEHPDRVCGAR